MEPVITPGNYYEVVGKKKRSFAISFRTEVIFLNSILLFPSAWFWTSVILKVSLGSDYFFDVFFDMLSQKFWGNLLLILLVIGLPGFCIGANGLIYIRRREHAAFGAIVIGTLFLALGFLAVMRRS